MSLTLAQVSLALAQRPGASRELSEEEEQMELSSDTARYGSGKKVTGVGAWEANSTPGSTPVSSKGSARQGGS